MASKPPERVLICGSRNWRKRYAMAERICALPPGSTIIHGFPAKWRRFGKRAGPIRNREMLATYPDRVLAFWDGESPGTRDTIEAARLRGIPVEIVDG